MAQAEIGIIGGSGLYSMPGLTGVRDVKVETPFGDPSDAYVLGTLAGRQVAFLARHGRGHRLLPTELNFRANICGFKLLGVERILSLSAMASSAWREEAIALVESCGGATHAAICSTAGLSRKSPAAS